MEKKIKKEYSNGELTVVWRPKKCIHSEMCVKRLPEVYKPSEKPWITPENATTTALKTQIKECPSGALTFYMNGDNQDSAIPAISQNLTNVTVVKNGTLMVNGILEIQLTTGDTETKEGISAFCRCGASSNKPYCDGSHKKVDFVG
jgi:uncharacterized Fe-S cluster protein YjdI